MSCRPSIVGRSTTSRRPRRPERVSAGSSISGRFVLPTTITLGDVQLGPANPSHFAMRVRRRQVRERFSVKPSISASMVLSMAPDIIPPPNTAASAGSNIVVIRGTCGPGIPARVPPIASISSINRIQLPYSTARFRQLAKIRPTFIGPMPTNVPSKLFASTLTNGTPASLAIILASQVLPLPGGPVIKIPGWYSPPIASKAATPRKYSTHWRAFATTSGWPL